MRAPGKLHYSGTDTEVKLGDKVVVKGVEEDALSAQILQGIGHRCGVVARGRGHDLLLALLARQRGLLTVYVYADPKFRETLELVDSTSPYALTGAVFA
jgi:hypothetical protein